MPEPGLAPKRLTLNFKFDKPLGRDRIKQFQQLDHGVGGFDALIADITAGTLKRLVHRIASQQAKGNRRTMLQAQSPQSAADRGIDILVVGCFTTNNTAKTNDRIGRIILQHELGREWDLPSSGNPNDRDAFGGNRIIF